jgi:hypothetical protein
MNNWVPLSAMLTGPVPVSDPSSVEPHDVSIRYSCDPDTTYP